jgi:hypothetical protein
MDSMASTRGSGKSLISICFSMRTLYHISCGESPARLFAPPRSGVGDAGETCGRCAAGGGCVFRFGCNRREGRGGHAGRIGEWNEGAGLRSPFIIRRLGKRSTFNAQLSTFKVRRWPFIES